MGRGRWAGGRGRGREDRTVVLRHAASRLSSTSQYVTFTTSSLRTVSANDAPIAPPSPDAVARDRTNCTQATC